MESPLARIELESELFTGHVRTTNHSPGPGRLVPSSHQRSELSNTILGTFSRGDKRVWKCIPVPNGLGEKATLISYKYSYMYFLLSENKTINVFPIDYNVQLSKFTSQ